MERHQPELCPVYVLLISYDIISAYMTTKKEMKESIWVREAMTIFNLLLFTYLICLTHILLQAFEIK